jgi:hypothetical protein
MKQIFFYAFMLILAYLLIFNSGKVKLTIETLLNNASKGIKAIQGG